MLTQIFAHAGEEHSETLDAVSHYLQWYIAIPAFFLILALIGYLTWLVSGKKLDTTVLIVSFVCLLTGFGSFAVSPIVSVIAITLGIILAGALTFLGLSGDSSKK